MPALTPTALRVAAFAAAILTADAASAETIKATFDCQGGKSIQATFETEKVALKLSDGRDMTLAQTPSGGGARYASAGDAVVFWNTGNTATLTEGQTETYSGCATK
jgi:membrane-bound inhibitor of C-type lysozyme